MLNFTLSGASSFKKVKVWTYELPHGSLRIELKASDDGQSSITIAPNGSAAAPIKEQIEPLRQVLREMPSLGLDPRKLSYVGKRLYEEDVVEKLAYTCADSQKWRESMRRGGENRTALLVALLNKSQVYEPYNQAFQAYGIRARVTEVEKVGLMRFSEVPARTPKDRAESHLLVPADAMVGMRFSAVDPDSK